MKFEKSAGAIVFREVRINPSTSLRTGNQELREYLLLAHKSMGKEGKIIWDFPKGLVGEKEDEKQTAAREVAEETGLSEFSFLEGFRETIKIFYKFQGDFINKTVVYFLAQATSDDVQISLEHLDFAWLPFEEVLAKTTFKNSRELLQKAEEFLTGGGNIQSKLL